MLVRKQRPTALADAFRTTATPGALIVPTSSRTVLTPSFSRPHVVILGAGASRAAFPDGDRHGRRLPLMRDLVDVVGLRDLLAQAGLPAGGDFETTYSTLKQRPDLAHVATELELRIRDYFATMDLPEKPTLYDHLVLSLRPKDVIATFNWDPFLVKACARNLHMAKPPKLVFLHGNTGIAVCRVCPMVRPVGEPCSNCGGPTGPTPLLFPITKKDYASDPLIVEEWATIRHELQAVFVLTIFGYSAPVSDAEAVALLSSGWARATKELEQVEIIDIESPEILDTRWKPFVHSGHFGVFDSFYDSVMARCPRRTCEATWSRVMEINWDIGNNKADFLPRDASWEELWAWVGPLVAEEGRLEYPTG